MIMLRGSQSMGYSWQEGDALRVESQELWTPHFNAPLVTTRCRCLFNGWLGLGWGVRRVQLRLITVPYYFILPGYKWVEVKFLPIHSHLTICLAIPFHYWTVDGYSSDANPIYNLLLKEHVLDADEESSPFSGCLFGLTLLLYVTFIRFRDGKRGGRSRRRWSIYLPKQLKVFCNENESCLGLGI